MTDSELREQLERGHVAAFGWALACCKGDKHEAEDVLHDSYLSVLNGRARFDARSSFQTWLFGVIRLTAASSRRRAWLRSLLLQKQNGAVPAGSTALPDADIELRSRNDRLRQLLNRLADRQRQILHLVFYQEMTIEEASRVMGISIGSARTHYARGKERLATLLEQRKEL
jgi:RNA polymerase sigma-70 factor (ECF subfamily)